MTLKLIAVDMDGTFLNTKRQYDHQRFTQILAKLQQREIKFIIATGDQYALLQDYFSKQYQEMNFIAENGANIYLGEQNIFQSEIKHELMLKVTELLTDHFHPRPLIVSGAQSAYVAANTSERLFATVKSFYPALERVAEFAEIEDRVLKIAMSFPDNERNHAKQLLDRELDGQLTMIPSGFGDMDINYPGINKANALKKLGQRWQIDTTEMAAFGDGGNDIEMLAEVKYSFAMANADQQVKKVARQVIGDNDSPTVFDTIESLLDQEL
ncbi:Cof-type HAD-IIB family hydrolase [Lapidilactobacillus wuchangensis]|uniref:Cof-type HAD-IIB family hydrolase n=1 Tax=Lapidilactobacillus wuchangensis TaxID=2486001 RepID=UPI000F7949CB|nr:Cof-type HAD-IIB family hydrolase [Lapidilactobacillus wuchangensis]